MSPASYRAAPPRVGEQNITRCPVPVQIRAGWPVSLLLGGLLLGELESFGDQLLGLLGDLGIAGEVALLQRRVGILELLVSLDQQVLERSEERRVGKAGVSTFRSRWS